MPKVETELGVTEILHLHFGFLPNKIVPSLSCHSLLTDFLQWKEVTAWKKYEFMPHTT